MNGRKEKKICWDEFLKYFIEEDKFCQNPLLKTKDFIKFCGTRGVKVREDDLEFFEKEELLYPAARLNVPIEEVQRTRFKKEGKKYWRPTWGGLQEGEELVEEYSIKLYAYQDFSKGCKKNLLELLAKGDLFYPSERPFQEWKSFKGERLENGIVKVVSFYSSFQVYALEKIKTQSFVKFSFAGAKLSLAKAEVQRNDERKSFVSCQIGLGYEVKSKKELSLTDEQYDNYLNFRVEWLKRSIDWETQKKDLLKRYHYFDDFLMFLLMVQSAYIPHMKSSSRKIQLSNIEDKEWQNLKRRFDLHKELSLLGIGVDVVCGWYIFLCKEAEHLLGGFSYDWPQLYKNISWDKKDKLECSVRLGIDYLQWAVMLKRVLEEHLRRRIFDVDEAKRLHPKEILDIDPCDKDLKKMPTRRQYRNGEFYDEKEGKDYYYDRYKRLFYLANSFDIDYQPRVMLFVEGKTEEKVLPSLFDWYSGISPEDMGVEIVSFEGVDQLLSTSDSAKKLRNLLINLQQEKKQSILSKNKNTQLNQIIKDLKEIDIVISNWTSFISYNLEKWQIIPFFLSDDEGNIKHFLEAEKPVRFEGVNYNVPKRWRFLWGVDNGNAPFKGKNFELANFTDEEIATTLTNVLNKTVS
ncbi:MAG: hypothetical protein KAQ85_10140, partial [Thermodesulfovibrionia bacterium]|nr:hypothetical protein [Thermodesulfovibrionia bacterium]